MAVKQPEITRELIIQSALDILSNTSYKAARLEDIAGKVGLTRGAIYWHFNNKQNLYKELLIESFDYSMRDIFSIHDSDMDPVKKVESVLNYLLGDKEEMHHKSAMIYNSLMVEQPRDLVESLEQVESWFSNLFDKHANVLNEGITEGSIIGTIIPEFEARAFYNFLWGYFTTRRRFFEGYNLEFIKNYVYRKFIEPLKV